MGWMLVVVGVSVLTVGVLASLRLLPRNRWVGLRVRATLRSDEAWRRANEASAWADIGAGLALAVAGTWMMLLPGNEDAKVAVGAVVVAVVLVLAGTVAGMRAIRPRPHPRR